ncbi:MAG: tripartite tricarboxylate transporter permease [Enterocloster sp.]
MEEGIAAPEAANNAVVASSMVPLMSLGIPGKLYSSSSSVLNYSRHGSRSYSF